MSTSPRQLWDDRGERRANQNGEIIRTLFASVSAGDYAEMAGLFAEDIEFETPFAPVDDAMHVVGRRRSTDVLTGIGTTFDHVLLERGPDLPRCRW